MNDSSDSLPPMLPHPDKVGPRGCIILIGMAASGKTTIGREIASMVGWAHMDTDHFIESFYGARLQQVTDSMSKEDFLDLEANCIQSLTVSNVVVSTGGSVVYRPSTMEFLATLGPLIHIDVPLPIILARIARKPDRGLAINPGQTIEDLYLERRALYRKWAVARFEGSEAPAIGVARAAAKWLTSPGNIHFRSLFQA